jgi:hypothetical protein
LIVMLVSRYRHCVPPAELCTTVFHTGHSSAIPSEAAGAEQVG